MELDTQEGKNDGTVKGMRYFHCSPGHGIFVAARAVSKAGSTYRPREPEVKVKPVKPVVNHGKVDVSHVQVGRGRETLLRPACRQSSTARWR